MVSDIPYNVIVLQGNYYRVKDEILDSYDDLLSVCKTSDDRKALLNMFWEEVVVTASMLILEKQIAKNAKIMKEIKESFDL